MELRYWLMIFCGLAILLILLDALRRKQSNSHYSGTYTNDMDELSDFPSAELPSGGAKVRALSPEEILERDEKLMLEHRVPLLMDSVDQIDTEEESVSLDYENPQHQLDFEAEESIDLSKPEPAYEPEEENELPIYESEDHDVELTELEHIYAESDDYLETQEKTVATTGDDIPDTQDEADLEKPFDLFSSTPPGQDLVEPDEVIVINVVSETPSGFNNENLMEIVLACGMRYGAMDIFHRTDEMGSLQFSMANVSKPGSFDIDNFSLTPIKGVSLFMTLPCSSDAMQSFDYMYETANVISRHLHGVMKDEVHSVMREQSIEHCRDRIREFAREQLLNL